MKIFQDKGKTILPRVDYFHLLTRLIILAGLLFVFLTEETGNREKFIFLNLASVFIILLLLFWLQIRRKRHDSRKFYFILFVFEIIFISLLIKTTEGYNSDYYLLYYFTITSITYLLTLRASLITSGIISAVYVFLVINSFQMDFIIAVAQRIGILWFLGITISLVSNYIRRSEKRLLKLFNTLNRRTAELEKSRAHLEQTYENTRILAGILDVDDVVKEVIKIMGQVLAYPTSALLLAGPKGRFIYRGRNIAGKINFHLKELDTDANGLIWRVAKLKEPVIITDIKNCDDYKPLWAKTRSVMLVPMVDHGRTVGILTVESSQVGAFGDKEQKVLYIVARGAAMALENAILHKKMEELTITDELTGIYNYRYFAGKLKEERRRAARYDLPLSLIMIDIDWFKTFNDTYGHEVGNIVLKGITGVLRLCVRDVDILCRYGGEEFAVILPQTPKSEVTQIGERIRQQIELAAFDGGGMTPELKVTVSIGISSFPENGKSDDELLSITDNALYRAKGSGRNTVCVN